MNRKTITVLIVGLLAFGVGYTISQNGDNDSPPRQDEQTITPTPKSSNGATLDLSGQQLSELPSSVLGRTDVKVLNLSNNQLTTLPAGITKLTSLEVLNVENNRLESLPSEISQLRGLREIRANNNRMESLPDELGNMTWLKLLDISGNRLQPSQIEQIKAKLNNVEIKT